MLIIHDLLSLLQMCENKKVCTTVAFYSQLADKLKGTIGT